MSQTEQNKGAEFKLERYKFILQQLHTLNENHHKYLSLYQALSTAVIGAGVIIFVSWRELKIDAGIARLGIRGLLGLLTILTLFVSISIVIGMFSWFDYRREEVELLKDEVGAEFRQRPNVKNLWRWPEVYLVGFIILATVCIYLFVEFKLMPAIQ